MMHHRSNDGAPQSREETEATPVDTVISGGGGVRRLLRLQCVVIATVVHHAVVSEAKRDVRWPGWFIARSPSRS